MENAFPLFTLSGRKILSVHLKTPLAWDLLMPDGGVFVSPCVRRTETGS